MSVAVLCLLGAAASSSTEPETSTPSATDSRWAPRIGASWQIQLREEIDTSVPAEVYEVDLFDTDTSVVDELTRLGRRVICYVNVGAHERWRPDASKFPQEVLGQPMANWPGERWLDVRRLDALEPIIASRFDLCQQKGFDAVDPDNMDGYTKESGFPLTAEDQLRFNRMVASLAHERGLGVSLKNDLGQVGELVSDFDFAVNESCLSYSECQLLTPFIATGKAVLHIEYSRQPSEFCATTKPLGFSSIRKPLDLTAPRQPCP